MAFDLVASYFAEKQKYNQLIYVWSEIYYNLSSLNLSWYLAKTTLILASTSDHFLLHFPSNSDQNRLRSELMSLFKPSSRPNGTKKEKQFIT